MDPRRGPGHVVPHRDQPRPGPSLGVHDPAHPGPVGRQRPGRPAGRRVIAFDGKTMRGARTPAGAPHLVAAFDHAAGAVVGQLAVSAKSNEIPALRDLLESMDITDSVVTADAMHCLRETAEHITSRGGHYVLTVKANQPTLRAACKALPWKNVPARTPPATAATAAGSAARSRPCRPPTGSSSPPPPRSSNSAEPERSRDARRSRSSTRSANWT